MEKALLSELQFERMVGLVKAKFGIRLSREKKEMLEIRLRRLMSQYSLSCVDEYYRSLSGGNEQYCYDLMEELTVHKTDFFREIHHFDFLQQQQALLTMCTDQVRKNREIKAWSAGCSSGEEPYTLAMVLKETMPSDYQVRVLATDISSKVLHKAQQGLYPREALTDVPALFTNFFEETPAGVRVRADIKSLVTFRQFNLMSPFPFAGKFDLIFCRNVMIYFDLMTQDALVKKFYDSLAPGGLLFIGHSESLTNREHKLSFVRPTIYKK